jgi:hypothetical protein
LALARGVDRASAMLLALALVLGANEPNTTVHPPPPGVEKARLDYHRPVACIPLAPSRTVPSGEYRVQCDAVQKKCFAAPNRVLVDGVEGTESLQRVVESCGGAYDENLTGLREGCRSRKPSPRRRRAGTATSAGA